ncbi:MAG: hypothetical protein KF764_24370 [Labilithrix sp.]|nr:hypothetical protein [Labilithrix sp.]
MARKTHPPPSSGASPFGLPGLGKGRGYPLHGDPTRGAALEAPTAPHATSPAATPPTLSGPARFWDGGRIRVALVLAFSVSLVAHWFVAPWNLLPDASGIEFKDPEGELSIPVDLIGEEAPPPPEPAPVAPDPPDPTPDATKDPTAKGVPDAGPRIVDAGADAAERLVAIEDAGLVASADGGAAVDAGEPDGSAIDDGGLVASADAGGAPGSGGPRDPESMFGLTKVVNAGVQNVVLGVNVALIRKHPVGARMGPILQALPQWRDFLKGASSPVDPIRDTDWILIYGPSLIHTDKDAVLVRYNASDDAVDATIASLARTYDKGGPFDAGVSGVVGSLGYADNAQRVFLRPQSKLLVIVPPSHAHEAATAFKRQTVRGPPATEAMRLIVRNPSNQISIPGLRFSQSLKEIRLWIIPRADGGADVHAEGDCTDEAAAIDSADRLTELLKRQNSLGVRFATRGLLNSAVVVADGTKIKLHVLATPEQLEAVLQLVAAATNAQIAPPTSGAAPLRAPPGE